MAMRAAPRACNQASVVSKTQGAAVYSDVETKHLPVTKSRALTSWTLLRSMKARISLFIRVCPIAQAGDEFHGGSDYRHAVGSGGTDMMEDSETCLVICISTRQPIEELRREI